MRNARTSCRTCAPATRRRDHSHSRTRKRSPASWLCSRIVMKNIRPTPRVVRVVRVVRLVAPRQGHTSRALIIAITDDSHSPALRSTRNRPRRAVRQRRGCRGSCCAVPSSGLVRPCPPLPCRCVRACARRSYRGGVGSGRCGRLLQRLPPRQGLAWPPILSANVRPSDRVGLARTEMRRVFGRWGDGGRGPPSVLEWRLRRPNWLCRSPGRTVWRRIRPLAQIGGGDYAPWSSCEAWAESPGL
jgi:hypothetical protein